MCVCVCHDQSLVTFNRDDLYLSMVDMYMYYITVVDNRN